jgi:hypothetical protein
LFYIIYINIKATKGRRKISSALDSPIFTQWRNLTVSGGRQKITNKKTTKNKFNQFTIGSFKIS